MMEKKVRTFIHLEEKSNHYVSQGETMTTDKQTSINLALSTINGKWKLSLMDELFQGTKRNGELMRALRRITQRVLTDRLREMEKDGLPSRIL